MKILLKIVFVLLLILGPFTNINNVSAYTPNIDESNLTTGGEKGKNSSVDNNNHLQILYDGNNDHGVDVGGVKGIFNFIIKSSRDLKNLFFIIAGLYFLIIVIKLIFSDKTEEEVSNFKKGILRISIGIIITQIAYYFITVLFDQSIDTSLATSFTEIIIKPFINLLELVAGFFFVGVMIYAFYRIVTANGNEETVKSGKMSVLYAAVGFIIIKISTRIVETIYGKTNCNVHTNTSCVNKTDLSGTASIIVNIINWMNGFIGIVIIIMIIYAGFLILTSGGEEDKLKKAKSIIIYIAIGLLILITNYLILTFFIPLDV